MIALAMDVLWALLLVVLARGLWLDVRGLCDRLVTLRERRLAADLAAETRLHAVREAAEAAMRPVALPADLELLAAQWDDDDAADMQRKWLREQYAEIRAKRPEATDDEVWQQVRVLSAVGTDGAGFAFSIDGMLQ